MCRIEPEISFIIVSWNAKNYLYDCLSSIFSTIQHIRFEAIVVDNNSSDGSWQMVEEGFPKVQLIKNATNVGFALANNQAIKISAGSYVCLINSDVELFPNSISLLYRYMETHPEIGILGPKVYNSDLSLQITCRAQPTFRSALFRALKLDTSFPNSSLFGKHNMTNWDHADVREVDILGGCCWMIRRTALNQVGLLDTQFFMYGEDMDFCKRFREMGWQVVFYPEAEIIHHGGGSSANAPSRFWIEMQRSNLKYWLKHNGQSSTVAYYCCLILHNTVRAFAYGLPGLFDSEESGGVRTKFTKNWRGLKWLLSPATILCLTRGNFD